MAIDSIPEMADPLGKHWHQPDRSLIKIDESFARMDINTFNKLPEYSRTLPSGVYEGKMWKAIGENSSLLRWYYNDEPGMCSIGARIIIVKPVS
jgi:hypothetical protein